MFKIYEGEDDSSGVDGSPFSGSQHPPDISVNTKSMYIKFVSDLSQENVGFTAQYSTGKPKEIFKKPKKNTGVLPLIKV